MYIDGWTSAVYFGLGLKGDSGGFMLFSQVGLSQQHILIMR